MHLNCSPYQAAKILQHSSDRPLFCLTDIDLKQCIRLEDYFNGNDDAYEDEEEVLDLEVDESQFITPPRKDQLFSSLQNTTSLTHVALTGTHDVEDVASLAGLTPQLEPEWINLGSRNYRVSAAQWAKKHSTFSRIFTSCICGVEVYR